MENANMEAAALCEPWSIKKGAVTDDFSYSVASIVSIFSYLAVLLMT